MRQVQKIFLALCMVESERWSEIMSLCSPHPCRHKRTRDSLLRSAFKGHTLKQSALRQEQLATFNSFVYISEEAFMMIALVIISRMHKATRSALGGVSENREKLQLRYTWNMVEKHEAEQFCCGHVCRLIWAILL